MHINLVEILGYIAAVCTLGTYSMKTMIPLRMCGIAANVFFISYGYFGAIYPTLILHVILLPLNSIRLYQMLQLVRRVRDASAGDLNMAWLKPFMSSQHVDSGEVLFRKGDKAKDMYFIVSGRFRLAEAGIDLAPATVVGELGLISPDQSRTQTLQCMEGGEVLRITYDQVKQLYFQNPKFGFYFMQLAGNRLFQNIARLEAELAARPAPGTS